MVDGINRRGPPRPRLQAGEIVVQHRPKIVRWVRTELGGRALYLQDVDDFVSVATLKILRTYHQFRGSNLSAWMRRVVRSAIIDEKRGRNPHWSWARQSLAMERVCASDDRGGEVDAQEAWQRTLSVVLGPLRISKPSTQTIWYLFLSGCSYPEIARITGENLNTVKSALNKGRARLRAALHRNRLPAIYRSFVEKVVLRDLPE